SAGARGDRGAAAARADAAAAMGAGPLRLRGARRRGAGVPPYRPRRRCRAAPRAARLLRGRGPGRPRGLAAALPPRPAARPGPRAPEGDVLAVGLAGAGRHPGAGPGPRAGPPVGLRVRAGARTLPPGPCRPLAGVL